MKPKKPAYNPYKNVFIPDKRKPTWQCPICFAIFPDSKAWIDHGLEHKRKGETL